MPNVSQMLRSLAKAHGVALEILQKDYALSYLLAGIAQTPRLGERELPLKVAQLLRKCITLITDSQKIWITLPLNLAYFPTAVC